MHMHLCNVCLYMYHIHYAVCNKLMVQLQVYTQYTQHTKSWNAPAIIYTYILRDVVLYVSSGTSPSLSLSVCLQCPTRRVYTGTSACSPSLESFRRNRCRELWRSASEETGALSVTTSGTTAMLLSPANSWASTIKVETLLAHPIHIPIFLVQQLSYCFLGVDLTCTPYTHTLSLVAAVLSYLHTQHSFRQSSNLSVAIQLTLYTMGEIQAHIKP